MYKLKMLSVIILLSLNVVGFSQRTTIGLFNGINFSDINNAATSGKWQSMPGPTHGLYLNYKINKSLTLQTEVDFITLYYKHISYYNKDYTGMYPMYSNIVAPCFQNPELNWDFSYLRFPVLFKFNTPTRLSFTFSIGMYYSKLISNNYVAYNEYNNNKTPNYDYGYMFATGVSYYLQNRLNLSLGIRYAAGKKLIIPYNDGYNGNMELNFGIEYSFKSKKKEKYFLPFVLADTLKPKLLIEYSAGVNFTQNFGEYKENYDIGIGALGGITLIYNTENRTSLQTGILFERKTYNRHDTINSDLYVSNLVDYLIDTKTDIDYIKIPLSFSIYFNKKARFYINTGVYLALRLNARVVGHSISKTQNENSFTINKTHIYNNIEGNVKNADWGGVFSAGYKVSIFKKYKLDINLSYSPSFGKEVHKLRSVYLSTGIIIPLL